MKTATTNPTPDVKTMFEKLETTLDLYFAKKAPAMPESLKEAFVKYGPYITLILMIMALPVLLAIFGLSAVVMPFAYLGGLNNGFNFSVGTMFSVAILIMQAIALPALFKRQMSGWKMLYYVALVQVAQNLFNGFNLVNLVFDAVISFYILFQIKSYYK